MIKAVLSLSLFVFGCGLASALDNSCDNGLPYNVSLCSVNETCYALQGGNVYSRGNLRVRTCNQSKVDVHEYLYGERIRGLDGGEFCACELIKSGGFDLISDEPLDVLAALSCNGVNAPAAPSFAWPESSVHPFATVKEFKHSNESFCRLVFVSETGEAAPVALIPYQKTSVRIITPFVPIEEEDIFVIPRQGIIGSGTSVFGYSRLLEGWFWFDKSAPKAIPQNFRCALGMPWLDSAFPVIVYDIAA